MKKQNPKLEGSNLIDCIPQKGYCPNKCEQCFYNNGFFLDIFEELPLMPTIEEVGDKIVRVNSGNDSNNDRDLVIKETEKYSKKFYNTSRINFDFPGPVVFTSNGYLSRDDNDLDFEPNPILKNVMFIRIRVNTWEIDSMNELIDINTKRNIPTMLTFMRYNLYEDVENIEDYEIRKSILNTYWCIKEEAFNRIVEMYADNKLVEVCGGKKYGNSYCKNCRNCEKYYNNFMEKKLGLD